MDEVIHEHLCFSRNESISSLILHFSSTHTFSIWMKFIQHHPCFIQNEYLKFDEVLFNNEQYDFMHVSVS
jgi:hypothetical protein